MIDLGQDHLWEKLTEPSFEANFTAKESAAIKKYLKREQLNTEYNLWNKVRGEVWNYD